MAEELAPATKNNFWQFNIGHASIILTGALAIFSIWTSGLREFDRMDGRIITLEKSDILQAPIVARVPVLETRIDIVQAQLNQLSMSTNRTSDAIVGMREDIASIKASLAAQRN